MRTNDFWLQNILWIYDYGRGVSILAWVVLGLSIFGGIWTVAEASGLQGSPVILAGLLLVSAISVGGLAMLSRALRWTILFRAIKDFSQKYLLNDLTSNEVLVGIGPGGAIAVGMVAKAIRELGRTPPSIIAFDMRFEELGAEPAFGELWPSNLQLPANNCWIIQGNVSSGRSLQKLRDKFSLQQSKVFAFVISDHVLNREKIDFFMAVGTRNILPWSTEKAKHT